MALQNSIGDKATDKDHQKQPSKKNGVSNAFDPMHSVQTARPQSPIGEQTGRQEDESICRQKIVHQGIDFAYADDNMGETNDGETYTDKRCRNREDVDADVRFELPIRRLLWHHILLGC